MSNDEPTFFAPDESWPGPVMPDERDDAQNADTTQVTNGVQTARATEMFVPASQAGGLVGVEHEDSEYDDDVATPRILLPALTTDVDMSAPIGEDKPLPKGRFADREISWMAFNQRVLEQSEDPTLPLLERAWFTAIFSSNLDEFYMVRVAGLKRRIAAGIAKKGASGLEPRQVLEGIQARTQELTARQARAFQDDILPALAEQGIRLARWDDVSEDQRAQLTRYFRRQIFPVLTPLAVDPSHPFPYISGLSLNLAVVVRNPLTGKLHFARVKVPQSLPRLINVDSVIGGEPAESYVATDEGTTFITLEDVVLSLIHI